VAVPPGAELTLLRKPERAPAKEYAFSLDPFQVKIIFCLKLKEYQGFLLYEMYIILYVNL